MIRLVASIYLLWAIGCGDSAKKSKTIIGEEDASTTIATIDSITKTETEISTTAVPEGIAVGNYNGDDKPFYAYVSSVDVKNETTKISFGNDINVPLIIPKTLGATISKLSLDGFDRDLLFVTAKIKDPNFNKYFLFVLRNNQWKQVVNGFAIHQSNLDEVSEPLRINPTNPDELERNYSVFNLDSSSPTGYTWLLLNESVAIENR